MTSTLDTSNRNPLDESVRSVAQEGVKQKDLHEAYVTLLDGRKLSVQVHKNADGEVLFNLVTNAIGLIEKDYFALAFYDNNVRKWLYTKKKISKQIKELPWEFSLEVKFYVPDPRQLNEDFTRHLFTLQLRIDLYEARLPAVILNQAKLGSLIAQAELGDYKPDCQYYEALKGLNIVRTMSPELAEKIIQFYKEQKGKTPPEAELAFLLECRENSMYGMAVFDATERNKPVRIGINASGISIFNDQLRRYIIIWQSMHQLEFQRKTFTIRLKPGEKEGKNSLSYKLDSEGAAKRCWKTAVEHHTFFRLVQPDDKNRRLFGSGTFRHEGRTLFQTQMASQMFDGTQVTGPHIAPSHLITQSGENITSHTEFSSAPFQKQADENTQPEFMATSGHHASKSPREAFSPQSTNGTTSEVGCSSSFAPAVQEQALSLNTSAAKPLFVTTTLVTSSSAEPSVLSRDVSQSLSPQLIQQLSSPHQTLRQEASELPTFEAQAIWQRGSSMSPASFHAVPTLLTSAWFSKRQRSLTPRPQTIVIEPDSAQFTTKAKTTTNMTRSATASPYAQMIPESGELFLPIVREMHQQTMTTLMTLPSRSHTVLAEYLSTTDTSHLSPDLISAYRNLLTAGGNTPSQAEEKIRSILNNRVYCRRSPLSPPTLNSPLPPDVEFACKTRSPSPTVRFDESVNHCIRIKIVEVNNETPIYQYNVSAAEAHRAAVRGGYSPSRQGYTSLTREEGNRQEVQETPKRSFFGQRKRRHPQPFLRAENTPIYNLRKDDELQEDPIRFHSNVYHSGLSGRQIVRRFRHTGIEEIREVTTEEYSYLNRDKLYEEPERLEKEAGELQSQNIRSVVNKRSSPQRSKRRRFTPSRPHFSTPTSVLNLHSRRQDSHDHTNGFASLDLSPIPATQPSTSYYKEMPSDKITELIVQTTDVEPSKSGQVEISGQVVSRNRRYRFFTRSHPQQERSIERPDYRLDTSVFVGVPEDLKRGIEVEHQPIKEHCSPYYKHSYTRKTKKTTTKIGRTEESDEESAPEVEDTEETQKRTARIHLKSGEHEPEKQRVSRSLFAKKEARPKKAEVLKQQRLPTITEPYTGPLDPLEQQKEFDGATFEECVVVCRPSTSETTQIVEEKPSELKKAESPEKSKTKHGLFGFLKETRSSYPSIEQPYEGPLEVVPKAEELSGDRLRQHVEIYHSGYSLLIRNRRYRFFTRERHEGEEEIVEKFDPSVYKLDVTPFEGTAEALHKDSDFESHPIRSTCQIYHPGISYVRRKQKKAKPGHEDSETSSSESDHVQELTSKKRPSKSQLKTTEEVQTTTKTTRLFKFTTKQKTSQMPEIGGEPYAGELNALRPSSEFESKLFDECVTSCQPSTSSGEQVKIVIEEAEPTKSTAKLFLKSREVEMPPQKKDKSAKKSRIPFSKKLDLSSYPSKSEVFETTEVIGRDDNIEQLPISEFSTIYHPGTSYDVKKQPIAVEEIKQSEEHVSRTAKITVRSKEVETDEPVEEPKSSKFFAFTKRQKTDKEPTALDLSSYPQKSDPIETTEVIGRDEHLESLPISEYSTTYHPGTSYDVKQQPIEKQPEFEEHVGRTAKIVVKSKEVETEAPKSSKFFAFTKRQKEPKLSSMPQIGEIYEGPVEQLNRSNDADLSPLEEHGINVQSVDYPTTSTQIIEVPHGRTAKIVVKSKEVEMPSQKKSRIPFSKKLDLSSYPQKTEVFETSDIIGRDEHLDSSPLEEHGINVQSIEYPTTSTQIIEVPHGRTAKITIRSTQITEEPESVVDIEKKPKTKKSLLEFTSVTRRFKSDKEPKLSSMPQIGEVYEGPVEELKRDPDHETSNINSFVDYVYVETPTDDKKSQKIKIIIEQPSEQSDEGQQKQTAVLHIRSLEDEESEQSEVPKEQKRSVFGFLRRGEKKHEEKAKSPSTSSYPLPIAPDDSILYDTSKDPELEESPLAAHIEIREPEVPTKAEALQKRPDYPLHEAPFEGNLESTVRVEDFEQHPILDYSSVYHPGTITKTKAPKPAKKEKQVEESPEKQTAHIHTTTTEHEVHETSPTKEGKSLFGYFKGKKSDEPSTSYQFDVEPYTGPLDLIQKDEFNEDPLASHVEVYYDGPDSADVSKVKKRESHQEIKLETRKNGYPAQEEEYSGPLEVLTPSSDVENLQLGQVVDVNEENQVLIEQYIKLQKLKKSEKQGKQSIAEEETEEHQRKLAAKIHVKSDDEEQLEASKPKSLFGFLKSSKSKKHDEDIESPKSPDYPTIVLPSDFQAPPINKEDEIEESPLELPEATLITTHKRYRLFMRDEGEKENLGKSPYPFDKEPYEGQLEFIEHSENLEPVPINQYVNVYYNEKIHGKRRLKMPKIKLPEREVKTAEESSSRPEKKTALIRLKEKEDVPEQQVESRFWRKHRPEKDDQQRTILSNAVYGLSSEQFGVSDELNRQKDFNSEPIKEHVDVKHPGFSTTKSKAPRKLEELDPNADRKTAVLHLRSIENIDENLSHTSSDTPAFFGFLRGRKGKKKEDHSYPAIEQPYSGELDLLKPDEQLFEDPSIIVASLVAYPDTAQKPKVQKDIEDVPQDKKTAIIHLKHEEIVDVPEAHDESKQSSFFAFKRKQKEVVSQYPKSDSYQGPLEIVTKDDELIEDPNIIVSSTISSPTELSPTTRKRQLNLFLRKKSEPEESAKETKVSYNFDPTEYTGDYDSLHHSEFDQSLLSEHVAPTQQPTEKSKLKLFGFGQKSAEEKLDEEEPKQTAILHLKTTEFVEEPTVVKEVKQKRRKTKEIITTYPTRTVYEGELESTKRDDELETDPNFVVPETISYPEERQVKGLKLFLRHEKPQKLEEEVVVIRRTAYDFDPAKFEGEHQNLQHEDFPQSPLFEHVELPAETILPETTAKKSTALITLKTTEQQEETPVEVVKEKKRWSLIPQRKTKEIATSYPTSEQFTGELESTKCDDELEVEELEKKIDVEDKKTTRIHLKTTEFVEEPKVVKEVKQKRRKTKEIATTSAYDFDPAKFEGDYDPLHYNEIEVDPNFIVPETAKYSTDRQVKGLKLFLRRQPHEETATTSTKSAYDFDPAKFEGELESTSRVNDFTQSPLSEHVDLPSELQEEVPAEAKEKKSTALITFKTTEFVEEPKAEKKRKTKELVISQYPKSDLYEGELESTKRDDEIEVDSSFVVPETAKYSTDRQVKGLKLFLRRQPHEETATTSTKSAYDFDPAKFEGELESTSRVNDFTQSPLSEHVDLPSELQEEVPAEAKEKKSTALITLKTTEFVEEPKAEKKRKTKELPISQYPKSDLYEGDYDPLHYNEIEVDSSFVVPETAKYSADRQVKGLKLFLRRQPHEETATTSTKSAYDFSTTPFEGEHQDLSKTGDFAQSPISEHVDLSAQPIVVEEVKVKRVSLIPKRKEKELPVSKYPTSETYTGEYEVIERPNELEVDPDFVIQQISYSPESPTKTSKGLKIFTRHEESVEEPKVEEKRTSWSLLPRRKTKEITTSYPTSEPFTDEVEEIRKDEFAQSPLSEHVESPAEVVEPVKQKPTALITLKKVEQQEETPTEVKQKAKGPSFFAFTRKTKEVVTKSAYDFDPAKFEGEHQHLNRDNEFEADPSNIIQVAEIKYPDVERNVKGLKIFTRHEEPQKAASVTKSSYDFDPTEYTGDYGSLHHSDIEQSLLSDHVAPTQHPAESIVVEETPAEITEKRASWSFIPKRKEKEVVSQYPTSEEFVGDYEEIKPNEEFVTDLNIITPSDVPYPQPTSPQGRLLKLFLREKHPGEEEVAEEKSKYSFDTTAFEGDYDPLHREHFTQSTLEDFVAPTQQPIETSLLTTKVEESPETEERRWSLLFKSKEKTEKHDYPVDVEEYSGPYEVVSRHQEVETDPDFIIQQIAYPEPSSKIGKGLHIFTREKDEKPPAFDSTEYTGDYDSLHHADIKTSPLLDFVAPTQQPAEVSSLTTKAEESPETEERRWSLLIKRKEPTGVKKPAYDFDLTPFAGEYEIVSRHQEIETDPSFAIQQISYLPEPSSKTGKGLHIFTREKDEKPSIFDTTPFNGQHELLSYDDLDVSPILDYVDVIISPPTELEAPERKSTALITLKKSEEPPTKIKEVKEKKSWSLVPQRKQKDIYSYPGHEIYIGPYETLQKNEQLEAFPLSEHVELREAEPIKQKSTALIKLKEEQEPVEEKRTSWSLIPKRKTKEIATTSAYDFDPAKFEGDYDPLHYNEIEVDPNFIVPETAKLPEERQVKGLKLFLRKEKPEQIATTSAYDFDPAKFEGELESTSRVNDFTQSPLSEHVDLPSEVVEPVKQKSTALITFKTTEFVEEPKVEEISKKKRKTKELLVSQYPKSDLYEGELEELRRNDEFETDPSNIIQVAEIKYPESTSKTGKGLHIFTRHEESVEEPKVEEISKKKRKTKEVKKSSYVFDSTPFTGESEELRRSSEVEIDPDFVIQQIAYPESKTGKGLKIFTRHEESVVEEPKVEKKRKTKELIVSKYPTSEPYTEEYHQISRDGEFETDPNIIQVVYPETTSKTGKGLHIFTRNEEPTTESVEEPKVEQKRWSLIPKRKETTVSQYPANVYTGEYHQISRDGEFETDPNIIQVAEVKYPDSERQVKGLKIFTRNEESVPTKSAYDFDSTEYSGNYDPLHHSDIEALPLSEHVSPTQQPAEIIEKSTLEESPSGIKEKKRISWTFLSGQKGVASQYPTSTYEGELEELRRSNEFETDPNIIQVAEVKYPDSERQVKGLKIFTRNEEGVEEPKVEEIPAEITEKRASWSFLPARKQKEVVSQYPTSEPYVGEMSTTKRDDEFETDPNIIQITEVKYPSPQGRILKLFLRERHEGVEEVGEEKSKYEFSKDAFEGEYDPLHHKDIEASNLSDLVAPTQHPIEPVIVEEIKVKRVSLIPKRKEKEVTTTYPTSEPYTGEYHQIDKSSEVEIDPDFVIQQIAYPESKTGKGLHIFTRGKEEKPPAFDNTPFTGTYDPLHRNELEAAPLTDFVELPIKKTTPESEIEVSEPIKQKSTALITLKQIEQEPIVEELTEKKSWSLLPKRKTKEITTSYPTNVYTGEYQEIRKDEEFEADPNNIIQVVYPETTLKTGKGLKIFTRGKEPIEVKTSSYDFDLAKFEGEHQNLQHEDFTQSPLSEHVDLPSEVVEPITEEIKEKKRWSLIPKRKEITTSYLTSEPFTGEYQEIRKDDEFEVDPNIIQASEVSYPETTSKTGKGLKIFTRNEEGVEEVKQEPIVTEEKRTSWSLLPRRKTKELIVSQYPTSEPFVGELQSTNRDSEFETDPNIIQVAEVKYPETSRQTRGLKIFTRHEGVEEVGEEKSKYSFDATAFEGEYDPLHHTDIKTTDLTDFVAPTQQPAEPVVVEEVKVKRKTKEIATTYPTSEPFVGEYDPLHRDDELETDPSFVIQQISYSPEPTAKIGKGLHIFTRGKEPLEVKKSSYAFDSTPFVGDYEVLKHQEVETDPSFVIQQIAYPESTSKTGKGLHIFTREKEPLEVKKSKYPQTESYQGTYDSLQRNEFNEEEPLSKHVSLYHQDLPPLEISQHLPEPTTSKQTALIYLKSTPEQLKPALKIEAEPSTKPAKQSIWSVFRKRRRAESPSGLEPVAAARRIYESELVGGMSIGNASLFKSGEPVTDLDIDLFLRKHETSQYHVELLLRDLRTTEFPVLFDGRRGPKFLPRSLLEASNDEASISLREPRSKRPKPDSSQQQPPEDPQESEEGDVSSMASLPSEDNETPKRHKLHHKQHQQHESSSQTTTLKSDRIPPQTEQKSSLLQQLFQIGKKSSKSPAKEELKRKLSSSSSDEEVEIEERHKIQSSTTAPHKVLTKEHDSSSKRSKRTTDNMFKTITNYANELKSEGPYTPANDKHGQVIRHEKVDQVYRITGAGQIPHFDPTDPETNPPRTTLQSWHEKTVGPETVTEEVDEHGNLIRKTIKTEQVKHTVQKQSYQTYTVDDDKPQSPSDLKQTLDSIQSISSSIPTSLPSGQTHVLVYGRDGELREPLQNEQFDENQSVSTKVVTTGNRTIETITYKNVKDGVVHTNVEHRVTITGPEIDQDAELRRAIAEATGLNPKYEVQRIEIKEERLQ